MRSLFTIAAWVLLSNVALGDERPQRFGGITLDEWRTRLADFDAASPRAAAAVPALAAILADEQVDDVTRRAAALALGRIGRPARSALPTLISLIEPRAADEALAATWAAKSIALMGPHGREATLALAQAAGDSERDFALRQLSLEALAHIGGAHPAALPGIIAVVQLNADEAENRVETAELRQLAVEALGVAKGDAAVAVPLLARIVQSPSESETMRRLSAESLAAIGPPARIACQALAEAVIVDPSEAVRDSAGKALGAIGVEARPQLELLLRHSDAGARSRSAKALGELGEAARPLVATLQELADNRDEAEIVRLHAAGALWKIEANADQVWPTAVALLASEDRPLRMQSLGLLLSLGDKAEAANPQLRELTRHPRRDVQVIAEQALRKIAAEK